MDMSKLSSVVSLCIKSQYFIAFHGNHPQQQKLVVMEEEEDERRGRLTVASHVVRQSSMTATSSSVRSVTSSFTSFDESVLSEDAISTKTSPRSPGPFPRLRKTGSDSDDTATYLRAEHTNAASRSMECLRQEHRSFLERGETRRLTSEMRRSQESFEEKHSIRGLAGGVIGRTPPSHLSLAPPSFERKLTILSPGWGDKKLKRPQVSLPRLILPTPDQPCWSSLLLEYWLMIGDSGEKVLAPLYA
ncbi:hypothetical protein GE061_008123 [Apolygus lucorum]|uniref:Uncharacterized protein n=1 Tax=Apolygus lucorum TaxID=248454 RepID=A0A8S9WSJ0_APOLU|nr:hypothetical protein GE061_008123 [Apolygus lucorum]